MTRLQFGLLMLGFLYLGFLAFMCLGAKWNRENDEAARRLADRHHRDNNEPEGER